MAFYNEAKGMTEARKNAPQFEFPPVTGKTATDIKSITGINVDGFRQVLEQKQANHIYKDHGENGRADKTMSDDNDVGRIRYVLENYDIIELGGRTDAYSEPNGRGGSRTARTVKLSKKVNGTYFVIEAVPDTNARTVYIVSAYMLGEGKQNGVGTKKEAIQQPADAQRPLRTSETGSVGNASKRNIAQPQEKSQVGQPDVEEKLAEIARESLEKPAEQQTQATNATQAGNMPTVQGKPAESVTEQKAAESVEEEKTQLQEEINAAGLYLTSKDNNKNNQRINAWIKENHPDLVGRVRFSNDKQTGTVTVLGIDSESRASRSLPRRTARSRRS